MILTVTLFILARVLVLAFYDCVDKPSLKPACEADLSVAEIYGLYPINVLPGPM
jgi:hypothetical protein